MAFNHVAIATRDIKATHQFYTEVMGFPLAKVEAVPISEHGWARHVFYDTGGAAPGLMAFWELHDDTIGEFDPAISSGLGLPQFVNHIAFDAPTLEDLDARKRRWLDHGHSVAEIDHGWCTSIYLTDPNGILVEFCTSTRELTEQDRIESERILLEARPELLPEPPIIFHEPDKADAPT